MSTYTAANLSVATVVLAVAVFVQLPPAQSMPILDRAVSSASADAISATSPIVKAEANNGVGGNSGDPGTPAYAIGQADMQRRAYRNGYGQGGYGRGGAQPGTYGQPYYAPRRSGWCYYHPYQC